MAFSPTSMLLMLLTLITGGMRDLASLVPTADYWKAKGVTAVSFEQLKSELEPVRAADVSKLIADLDADDPKVREAATERIAAVGPAAIPGLEDATKNGSPEVATRAAKLTARIRAASKVAAVRRLMAIRTLGERADAGAADVLKPLLDDKEMFVADYARAALARLAGKPVVGPADATEAERGADVALLPARLDLIAQAAPASNPAFSLDSVLAQAPVPDGQRDAMRGQMVGRVLKVLEMIGNVRLDAVTLGFYAAPPGVPGNTIAIGRGQFDAVAAATALRALVPNTKHADGVEAFMLDEDTAIVIASDHRVLFLTREPTGDLQLDAMAAALKAGAGDLPDNADLSKLAKSVDPKSAFWLVSKMSEGLREISGPAGEFDTVMLVGTQSRGEKDELITKLQLDGQASDAGKAKRAADDLKDLFKQAAASGRRGRPGQAPGAMKSTFDFLDSVQSHAEGKSATATAEVHGPMVIPFVQSGAVEVQVAPNGPVRR